MLLIYKLSQLARAANDLKVPYLASGGIADARGFAAALALGASVSMIAVCIRFFVDNNLKGINMGMSSLYPTFNA